MKRYAVLQKTVAEQSVSIQKLQQELDEKNKKIKVLQEHQALLKSALGQLHPEEKKTMEQSINRYIKEIEKCITLLSE